MINELIPSNNFTPHSWLFGFQCYLKNRADFNMDYEEIKKFKACKN